MLHKHILILLCVINVFIYIGCNGNDHESNYSAYDQNQIALRQSTEISEASAPIYSKSFAPPAHPIPMESMDSDVAVSSQEKQSKSSANRSNTTEKIPDKNFNNESNTESVSTNRMVVRNGSINVSVNEIETSIEYITTASLNLNGWVVSYNNENSLYGRMIVRIPSEHLDYFLTIISEHANEVISSGTDSVDVTDQYVDNTSRLKSLEATERALTDILNKASSVGDILKIRKELKVIQSDVEALKGKIKYLEQSTAFSRVNIDLRLTPKELLVDAGENLRTAAGKLVRFKATFVVPEGAEAFEYVWDFGDGSPLHYGNRTAPTTDPNEKTTATVSHVYTDDRDSPFVANIELSATGDSGIFKGKDSLTISVTRMPTIAVYAGDYIETEEGEEVNFEASFTRASEITEMSYKWEFGDGNSGETKNISDDESRISESHTYADHRSYPYRALVTIYGETESGTVKGVGEVTVKVNKLPGWTTAEIDIVDTLKFSVRSLSAVVYGIASALIWIAILSPIWGIVMTGIWLTVRYIRNKKRSQNL